MILLVTLAYIASNFGSAVLLGCMLQSAFVDSTTRFRLAVSFLGIACLSCSMLGVWALTELAALEDVIGLLFVQLVQSVVLMLVLLFIRLRQRAAGLDRHPKEGREGSLARFC